MAYGSAEEDRGRGRGGREGQSFGFHSGLSTRPDPDPDPDLPDLSPAQAPGGLRPEREEPTPTSRELQSIHPLPSNVFHSL